MNIAAGCKESPTIAALVPMRHSSERVPGKNYRSFGGVPLYHHIILTLLECPAIDLIVIDTDSDAILEDAAHNFPTVKLHRRPENLRDGMISMNDVLLHTVNEVAADIYLQTHCTNPLLRSNSICAAIDRFKSSEPIHDSLFSVTRLQTRLWSQTAHPVNHDPQVLLRTQDLEPLFEENSCLYLFSKESLTNCGNRIGKHPIMFEIDPVEAMDIDEEQDFLMAEAIYKELD